jgi:hypothetical protein
VIDLREFFSFTSKKLETVLGPGIKYFGIYMKLTDIPCRNLERICSDIYEEQNLFSYYLDLEISIKLLYSVLDLINDYTDVARKEKIKSELLACIRKYTNVNQSCHFFEGLHYLENKKKAIDLYLNKLDFGSANSTVDKIHREHGGLNKLYVNLAKTLRMKINEFGDVDIYILLDEFERITDNQKILINEIMRERQKYIGFKISSRRYGLTTLKTLNPKDFIIIGRDVELIDLEYTFRFKDKAKYRKLLIDVAMKRLESEGFFKKNKLTNIKKLLASITPEKEAKNLILGLKGKKEHIIRFKQFLLSRGVSSVDSIIGHVQCDQNPLVEKLNMLLVKRRIIYSKKGVARKKLYCDKEIQKMARDFLKSSSPKTAYNDLYAKNKLALLFQLTSEYRKRKIYAGFDTFVALSGGFTAWFLELCYNAFELAKDKGFPGNKVVIDIDSQRKAAENVAWDFLNKVVRNLPQVGIDVYYFILNIGAFFRALYSDELIREPEPTYFNTKTDSLEVKLREIIRKAHLWSVLQSKIPMRPKTVGEPLPDVHIIHPILAPVFQISYRTRGRTTLSADDVELLIKGTEKDIKRLIIRYRDKSQSKQDRIRSKKAKMEPKKQGELFD